MMKIISAVALLSAVAGSALAIDQNSSTSWACSSNSRFASGLRYCGLTITSGTTSAQIGSLDVDPTKQVFVAATASAAAVSGLVTPTLNFSVGGQQVASQSISATTGGNVAAFTVPYFDNVTVSFSAPSTISATNSVRVTVYEK